MARVLGIDTAVLSAAIKDGIIVRAGKDQYELIRSIGNYTESLRNAVDAAQPEETGVEALIKDERLRQLALGNEKTQDEAHARAGTYTLTADMKRELGIIATRILTEVEAFHVEASHTIAARGAVVPADILKTMRDVWRKVRDRSAKAYRSEAEALKEADHDPAG
jgi:hypothetical protein